MFCLIFYIELCNSKRWDRLGIGTKIRQIRIPVRLSYRNSLANANTLLLTDRLYTFSRFLMASSIPNMDDRVFLLTYDACGAFDACDACDV